MAALTSCTSSLQEPLRALQRRPPSIPAISCDDDYTSTAKYVAGHYLYLLPRTTPFLFISSRTSLTHSPTPPLTYPTLAGRRGAGVRRPDGLRAKDLFNRRTGGVLQRLRSELHSRDTWCCDSVRGLRFIKGGAALLSRCTCVVSGLPQRQACGQGG